MCTIITFAKKSRSVPLKCLHESQCQARRHNQPSQSKIHLSSQANIGSAANRLR